MKDWHEISATGEYWIASARLLDPVAKRIFEGAVKVTGGRIAEIREGKTGDLDGPILDAQGLCLSPSLIDMHVHLREPGFEHKETVATGSKAAARGGVTTMACMPNTDPVCDSGSIVRFIREQADKAGLCRVLPVGAITSGSGGERLADMGEMLAAGAIAFSDDGLPVKDSGVLRHAMEHSRNFDALMISHAEETSLSMDGVMHEGSVATRLGLKGIPRESEDIGVDRDIRLAAMTGARLHIAHVSSGNAVEIIRRAKQAGVRVTAETAPHYLLLDDSALLGYDSHKKMNPPIREKSDQEALVQGILDGSIDCIATDHAPHSEIEKEQEFAFAPFGVVGMETSLAALITRLVKPGLLKLPELVSLFTSRPAEILKIRSGRLEAGFPADLILFDPEETWTVSGRELASKSRNTPFEGMELTGRVRATFLVGQTVYLRESRAGEESESWHPLRGLEANAIA